MKLYCILIALMCHCGGAVVGASNSVVAQTGKNFAGFNEVNWNQVGISSAIGGVAGAAGGAAGYYASNASFLVNGISSPVLRSAVVSPLASGAGHVAGGTAANLFAGQKIGDAFYNSFDGIGQSMAIGTAIGISTTIATNYANGVNPWTGKPNATQTNNTTNHAQQRALERNVSQADIHDALQNPLKVTDVQYRDNGPSVKYIGNKATVVVNPETGKIITVHPTSTKLSLKLGGTR